MLKRLVWTACWVLVLALVMTAMPTGRAQAYLDPGSGSLIIQIIIGGILALLVAVKLYWNRIVGFVTGKKAAEDADAAHPGGSGKLSGDDEQ